MTCKVALCLTVAAVLLVPAIGVPRISDNPPSASVPSQSSQDAGLMQQADHQRRLMQQSEPTITVDETGAVTAAEEPSAAGIDIAVIVVMAVSGLAFLTVCRIRGRSTRQCIGPRRIRHRYSSRN